MSPNIPVKSIEKHSKSAARMAAVQALYQMETAHSGVEKIIRDFNEYWLSDTEQVKDDDGAAPPDLHHADKDFFAKLTRGVVEVQLRIDPYLERQLAKGWKLSRLDATVRAILRTGLFELIRMPDTPAKVVIDEYLNLAHAFFDADEPKFINGVLDAAAKEARKDEFVLN